MFYQSIDEIIGNTPLVELCRIQKDQGLSAHLLGKLECLNPTGSAKDRAALEIVADAERSGLLKPCGTIVEATSGNTGISLASIAASRGYQAIIVMPDTMSPERIRLMKAYGAQVVLSDGSKGMAGSLEKLKEVKRAYPGCFEARQFENEANALAHYKTTGPEIWQDTQGQVDILVASVGTGGTITGTGRYLKEKNPNVRIVAVEPAESPLLSKGTAGPHGIQGIGANFVPSLLDQSIIDEIATVTTEQACESARRLGKIEGIMMGISAGAALHAAVEIARKPEHNESCIVVILPDSGDRYLSSSLFD